MRTRSKTLMALWVGCLVAGVFATGAAAHGGHGGKNDSTLELEIRGTVTAVTPAPAVPAPVVPAPAATPPAGGSIVITAFAPAPAPAVPVVTVLLALPAGTPAPAPIAFTCKVPAGTDLSAFPVGTHVKAKCNGSATTGLSLRRLRMTDSMRDKVEVEASGAVTTFMPAAAGVPGSIVVATGVAGADPLTCAVTDRTRLRSIPAAGDMVKIECKTKHGVLTAKKIKVKKPMTAVPAGTKVEVKGAITVVSPASIAVGATTCTVADPTLVATLLVGDVVEMECAGNPLALVKVHPED